MAHDGTDSAGARSARPSVRFALGLALLGGVATLVVALAGLGLPMLDGSDVASAARAHGPALVASLFLPLPGAFLLALGRRRRLAADLAALRAKLPASEYRIVQVGGPGGRGRVARAGRPLWAAAGLFGAGGLALGFLGGGAWSLLGWLAAALGALAAVLAKAREAGGAVAVLGEEWAERHRRLVDECEAFCRGEAPAEKREERARSGRAELELVALLAPESESAHEGSGREAWFLAVERTAKVAESFAEALAVEDEALRARRLAGVRRLAVDREVSDADLRAAGVIDPRTGAPLALGDLEGGGA